MRTTFLPNEIGGWAVAVMTQRLGGGQPMLCLYAASFTDRDDAIALVKEREGLLAGDEIGNVYPLDKATISSLGMGPGEVHLM